MKLSITLSAIVLLSLVSMPAVEAGMRGRRSAIGGQSAVQKKNLGTATEGNKKAGGLRGGATTMTQNNAGRGRRRGGNANDDGEATPRMGGALAGLAPAAMKFLGGLGNPQHEEQGGYNAPGAGWAQPSQFSQSQGYSSPMHHQPHMHHQPQPGFQPPGMAGPYAPIGYQYAGPVQGMPHYNQYAPL